MPTYRIIGADGKEYGPISGDQMRQWIKEGRVNMQTRILVEGTTDWKTVADLPEFALPASPAPPPGFGTTPPPPPGPTALPTMPSTPVYGSAADQVNGPAIALIVLGAINIVLSLGRMVLMVAGMGMNALPSGSNNDAEKALVAFFGTFGLGLLGLGLIGGLIILFGGIKMRNLKSYGLCMTASILAMIPCLSCCFLIGIPVGIWALVVLSKPEVKNLFT